MRSVHFKSHIALIGNQSLCFCISSILESPVPFLNLNSRIPVLYKRVWERCAARHAPGAPGGGGGAPGAPGGGGGAPGAPGGGGGAPGAPGGGK